MNTGKDKSENEKITKVIEITFICKEYQRNTCSEEHKKIFNGLKYAETEERIVYKTVCYSDVINSHYSEKTNVFIINRTFDRQIIIPRENILFWSEVKKGNDGQFKI